MCQVKKTQNNPKILNVFKSVLFVAGALMIFMSSTNIVTTPDYREYQRVDGFYGEENDSLDAVYIGSSGTFIFWQAALGWNSYGITVWPYSTNEQPLQAARYIIEDARKTQPDALYIINIQSGDLGRIKMSSIHRLVDYMPRSVTKLKLIHSLCELNNYDMGARLEFYLPFYRYHTRWDELCRQDFFYELDGTKGGGYQYDYFLKNTVNVSGTYREMNLSGEMSDASVAYYEELFDYIEEENVRVLFISNTSLTTSEVALAGINQVMAMAEARGFSTLNLKDQQKEVGINTATDYYNAGHVNIHGSIKYTDYLAKYLVENYGFEDKRGQAGYESWDLAAEKYLDILAPYVVEEELDATTYDASLSVPELTALQVNGTTLTLKWKGVKGAAAYHIYRKQEQSDPWKLLAEVTADTLSYVDTDLDTFQNYTYTVVPQKVNNGRYYHGSYNFAGISATTVLNAPRLLELKGDGQSQTLAWEKTKGADGYAVYRKIHSKSWVEIADVGNKTSYTDTNLFGGEVPFQYSVRPYAVDENGNRSMGSYDPNGLLWLPQLQDIGLTASDKSGRIALSWDQVYGADRYYVYRRTMGSEWMSVTEPLSRETGTFEDIMARPGVSYQYRVTAALTYLGEEYEFAVQETDTWYQAAEDSVEADRPEIVFAERVGQGVELVWKPASNASAYRIYRKIGEADWTVLKASAAGNTYSDSSGMKGEEEASYIVQALYGQNGAVCCGEFSEDMAVTVRLEQEE